MKTNCSSLLELLKETHIVYEGSMNEDVGRWTVLARLCAGRGWCRRSIGYGHGWLTVVGPSASFPKTWGEAGQAPYVAVVEDGVLAGIAVQPEKLIGRRYRLQRRKAFRDLAHLGEVTEGRVYPHSWGVPLQAAVCPPDTTRYAFRVGLSATIYVVYHIYINQRWYTTVRVGEAQTAEVHDFYWVARHWLGKYVKIRNFT